MSNTINDVRFFQGGHSIFTVANPTGERYTFRIGRKEEKQPFFVGLLTGPDNEHSYTYLGVFNPETNEVRLTKKSRYTPDSKPVKVVQWAVKKVAAQSDLPDGYSIQHSGKCCCCGKTLTEPTSILNGIGPICASKAGWGAE